MIKKFRTKPVEIEAVQWTGENLKEIQEWAGVWVDRNGHNHNVFEPMGTYIVPDLNEGFTGEVFDVLHHTWIAVATGQWIVKGVKSEHYPCDNETFHWKYEEV